MSSINAKEVAREVSESIRKGKRVILGEIIKKRYAESTSKKPKLVTSTKSYQEIIKPVADGLFNEIKKIQKEMQSRNLTGEEYKTLAEVLDKTVKNYQLLSDKPTDITKNNAIEEIRNKLDKMIEDSR
jgi:hypothetical protein